MNRRQQQSKGLVAIYLVLLLSACTVINEHQLPPSDWPVLQVSVEETGFIETQEKCGNNLAVALLIAPMFACAHINFDEMKCRIYLWVNAALEHELLHCKGYDHIGSTALADYWNEWKKENRK